MPPTTMCVIVDIILYHPAYYNAFVYTTDKQIDEVMSIQMNNNLGDVNKKKYSLYLFTVFTNLCMYV